MVRLHRRSELSEKVAPVQLLQGKNHIKAVNKTNAIREDQQHCDVTWERILQCAQEKTILKPSNLTGVICKSNRKSLTPLIH